MSKGSAQESQSTPGWVDRHSVTCVLCGGYADERCSVVIDDESTELWAAEAVEAPQRYVMKRRIAEKRGLGEAHPTCFEYVQEHDPALDERLTRKTSRK